MSTHALQNFVNGKFVPSTSDERLDVINPATEEVYASSPISSEADVNQAYVAAANAFETWGDTTPSERSLALFRIADAMEARAQEFAEV